jgi:hypothetical protein
MTRLTTLSERPAARSQDSSSRRSANAVTMAAPSTQASNDEDDKLTNISRIDTNRAHGWRVRFEQGRLQISKLFSDRVYGSKDAARDEAIQYRDEIKKRLRTSQHDLGVKREDAETNTGLLGITYVESETGDASASYFNAMVRLTPEKVVRRRFQLKTAGYDRVLQQAVRWQRSVLKGRRRN